MHGIEIWIGLDVGKADHHATVLDAAGQVVFDRPLRNDELVIERLLEDAGTRAALVIDQPGSIGALAVAVARRRGVPVAYVPRAWSCAARQSSIPARPRPTGATASCSPTPPASTRRACTG